MSILNLGAGSLKIYGADNVDINPELGTELCFDLREKFPLEDKSYDEIYLFHTIEHIEKKHHTNIFAEIRRVLKDDGMLLVTYPEFSKIVQNWLINKDNQRHFWEATVYGRQLYSSDYHVCAMDSADFKQFLMDRGFEATSILPEPMDIYNTILRAKKGQITMTYEEVLYNEVFAK